MLDKHPSSGVGGACYLITCQRVQIYEVRYCFTTTICG